MWEYLAIVGFIIVIWMVFWCVYGCFGPQYVECKCGAHCRVSEDGWFYWECDECGASGKAHPFK